MWNWKIYLCNSMSTLHDSPLDLDPETVYLPSAQSQHVARSKVEFRYCGSVMNSSSH